MPTVQRFRLRFGEKGVRMAIIRGRWSEFRMPNSHTVQWFRVFGHALKRQELQGCAWVVLSLRDGVKILLRHSETCGRGRVCDFHGAHLSFAGARRSLFFAGFALPLENREENDAFLAFVRWALPRMLANHLFLRFVAFSCFSLSLSLFVLFASFFSTTLPLLR